MMKLQVNGNRSSSDDLTPVKTERDLAAAEGENLLFGGGHCR